MDEDFDLGNRPDVCDEDYFALALWESYRRARKRAADEMGVSDVSAEAAPGASSTWGDGWKDHKWQRSCDLASGWTSAC